MKIWSTILSGLCLCFSLLLLTSCGETEAQQEQDQKVAFSKTTNKPGKIDSTKAEKELTEEEKRKKRRQEEFDKRFEEGDKNGDGYLTQEEIGNFFWLMVFRADEDGDGMVSKEDIRKGFESGMMRKPVEPTKVIEIMDTDSDGFVNSHELPEQFRL